MKRNKSRSLFYSLIVVISSLIPFQSANAIIGYADVVLDFYDSGAGPVSGPYGGTWNGSTGTFPISVSTDVVIGDDPGYPGDFADFLSLATGSFVTVGFTDETIIDGVGDDIFITEVGASGESADVFVSSDLFNFVFLGTIFDNITTALDLADIGFTDAVQAIKIVGNDNFGGSPGFDVINIRVLPGSIGPGVISVPVPATLALMGLGLFGMGFYRKKINKETL